MKLANKTIEITTQEVENIKTQMDAKELSKGAAIRKLFAEGYEVKQISETLGIRYNHCYNVISNEIIIHDLEVEKAARGRTSVKKDQIVQLLQDGKTIKEISEETKTLYNSVWQIAKAAGLTKKQQEGTTEETAEPIETEKKSKKAKTK